MKGLLGIGEKFPDFSVSSCVSIEPGKEFKTIDSNSLTGKWSVVFFWPLDFTFVCPTELAEFNKELKSFASRETQVFGVSADSQYVHLAWRQHHPALKQLGYPMLSDYKKELCDALGILHLQAKVPLRATYIVDPTGTIRWVSVNDLKVGRNVKEILRTLDALQSDQLCPCNWEQGQEPIRV